MNTIGDFIKENNLQVEISVVNGVYICHIKDEDGTFTFSMTKEKLYEHISRFSRLFVQKILENENMIKTHFMRLALTWYHIQAVVSNPPKEITID